MINLLSTLSQELQELMAEYRVSFIGVSDYNELIVKREYDWDYSFFIAIENELRAKGFKIE